MEGISLPADREKLDGLQTSRVRIIVLKSVETTGVMLWKGITIELTRTQRSNTQIFLI